MIDEKATDKEVRNQYTTLKYYPYPAELGNATPPESRGESEAACDCVRPVIGLL